MKPYSSLLPIFLYVHLHLLLLFICFCPNRTLAFKIGNQTDHLSLIKFKESIFNDPNGISFTSEFDKVFTSEFWKYLFQLQGTTLAMSSAYHPQTDGQSEALNKCLEMYLRCFTFHNPKSWYKALPWAEFWYNTSLHASIGMTPFRALYGRDPPALTRYDPCPTDTPAVQEQLLQRDQILTQLKDNLSKAQQYMKTQADKKRRDVQLDVGQLVLVKLQPYRQHSAALRKHQKLGMKYFGPFPIEAKIGSVAYRVTLPEEAKIHPVFHVSQLKVFKGADHVPYLPLPLTMTETSPILQPAAVLKCRTLKQGDMELPQVLIQWENLSTAEATWENVADMQINFPLFNLEDKVASKGEGIVTGPTVLEGNNIAESSNEIQVGPGKSKMGIQGKRKSVRQRTPNVMLKEFVTS